MRRRRRRIDELLGAFHDSAGANPEVNRALLRWRRRNLRYLKTSLESIKRMHAGGQVDDPNSIEGRRQQLYDRAIRHLDYFLRHVEEEVELLDELWDNT
jgi:hypothetical protein